LPSSVVADENCHAGIIAHLRNVGFTVLSVRESQPGISDSEVLELAASNNALLVTEDSDFGELVFSHHNPSLGVIFLRYVPQEWKETALALASVLSTRYREFFGKFSVLTKNRLRVRDIP
jgi:predicted nuclease of predicted toxin-antitoxin system